jgi:hypothetical protein
VSKHEQKYRNDERAYTSRSNAIGKQATKVSIVLLSSISRAVIVPEKEGC